MRAEGAVRKEERSRSEKSPHGSVLNLAVNPYHQSTVSKSLSQKNTPEVIFSFLLLKIKFYREPRIYKKVKNRESK